MFTKKLGFGLMRPPLNVPNDRYDVNMDKLKLMIDTFLERDFCYFDTAYVYANYEECIKEALVRRHPREGYKLATKMPLSKLKTAADQERIFAEQLARTDLDYFDAYLLHDMGQENYAAANKFDSFSFLEQKKKDGAIRRIGFSFHDHAGLLDEILTEHPEFEFVQLQINYLDWDNKSIQSGKCYQTAQKHGKPVIVMEPVKGGILADIPEKAARLFRDFNPDMSVASWAVRYAASLDGVSGVLSGMSDMEQLLDNTGYMREFRPLSSEERAVIAEVLAIIGESIAVPCTGCSYCADGCPEKIAIPNYFSLYNNVKTALPAPFYVESVYYNRLAQNHGKASDCVGCGQCEKACPQHIAVTQLLKEVAKTFEIR
ncbi:MAG: aldo/keto reductase [Deltaproteobacteria bacterium]|jgi:predicted aldo/keto reductase-like oxidoreductase|nr:aldo/keto reductase [Deltaproteobacteria bacterium]